jgi:short-subunit dehydrogenase
MQLEFPSSQRIEVLVKNEAGKVISRSSDDQRLDKEQGFLVINPEERLEYTAIVATRDMTAGQAYIIEAFFPGFDELRASRAVMPTK